MDQNRLKNYRNDMTRRSNGPEETSGQAGEDLRAAVYHQEINTLKIEKLSQRITIISIIIPCIIIAILTFAYLDMKERVVDVDETQDSHVSQIARIFEEKLNALDVRVAKTTFDLDEKLVMITKKSSELERQTANMSAAKADLKSLETALTKLERIEAKLKDIEAEIKANADHNSSTLVTIDKIKQQLRANIKQNNAEFNATVVKITDEIQLFKEEFDARLLELSAYEQEIAALTKATSLLDKKVKNLTQDIEKSRDKKLQTELRSVKQDLEKRIQDVENKLMATKTPKTVRKPSQRRITHPPAGVTIPDPITPPISTTPSGISEQNLTQ